MGKTHPPPINPTVTVGSVWQFNHNVLDSIWAGPNPGEKVVVQKVEWVGARPGILREHAPSNFYRIEYVNLEGRVDHCWENDFMRWATLLP